MRRFALLATLALAAAAAVPAHADYPPTDCQAYLVMAAANQQTGCDTIGVSPVPPGNDERVMTVYVQTGQVTATLGCGGAPGPEYRTITVTAPYSGSARIERTSYCWMTITATVDGTTAVGTNESGATVK